MKPTVHVVPHTHWDREWYRPQAAFEVRLAHLVDEVLDLLARRALPVFLLDGQGVVLDDYARARPEAAARLARQLRAGRLECGPWYVLADNFLVSGEAMVRNLLEGERAVARAAGRSDGQTGRRSAKLGMQVGYAPDTFGHPAILPTLFAGFGIVTAVTWRGFGGEKGQERDLYRWRGPDGGEVLMIHLPPAGYENGANLATVPDAARERWAALRKVIESRARSPHWLVMNGADHHVAQPDLLEAVRLLGRLAPDCRFVIGSFADYARAVTQWSRSNARALPQIAGELREGRRHAWVLLGTHSARLYLKQANAECQRLLERVAEPLVALGQMVRRSDGQTVRGLREDLHVAWRMLLENHPHDSICGTSADEVHREMVTRFDRVRAMGREIVDAALNAVIGFDPNRARVAPRESWQPCVVVFNPGPGKRSGVIEAEVALFTHDVRVGQQGPKGKQPRHRPKAFELLDAKGRAVPMQELSRQDGYDRLESPRHYPDADGVESRRVAIALKDLPPLGVTALRVKEVSVRPSARPPGRPVVVTARSLENEHLAVRVEPDGTISLATADGLSAHSLGAIETVPDEGDSYTSSPRQPNLSAQPDGVATRVVRAGPLRGEIEVVRRYDKAALEVVTRVQLDAGARRAVLALSFTNSRGARRIRAAFPLGERLKRIVADGPFGPVERSVTTVKKRPGELESPDPCAPMQRYVSVAGAKAAMTVFSDGLPQYEARPGGELFITLLRAFDQMSRGDLPERPGHAGWPTPTPEGQCIGPVVARLAVMLHGPGALDTRDELESVAESFLAPPVAFMRRALLEVPESVAGPELSGAGLVFSAMKPAESGRGVVLRCYNGRSKAVRGAWCVGWPVRSAVLCRLDERVVRKLAASRRAAVNAAPREIVTLTLR